MLSSSSHTICLLISSPTFQGLVVWIMMGSISSLIVACCQLNFGSYTASHGYLRSISSFPMSVTRNVMLWLRCLVVTLSVAECIIFPSRFSVLSMFHIPRGFFSCFILIPIHFANWGLMKLLVAPESTNTLMSALLLLVHTKTGTCID